MRHLRGQGLRKKGSRLDLSDSRWQQRRWRGAVAASRAFGFFRRLTRDFHIEHAIGASRTDHQADRFARGNVNMGLRPIGEVAKAGSGEKQHSEEDQKTHLRSFMRGCVSRRCGGLSESN